MHQLTWFSWDPPHALSTHLLKTLWHRQHNLHRLEILPTYSDPTHSQNENQLLVELNAIELSKCKAVRIVPDNTDTAYLGCAALQIGVITELEVDARLWQDPM